jgi:hypothetical protein
MSSPQRGWRAGPQNKEDAMAITVVSRWKGKEEDVLPIAREGAALLKNRGATSVRMGTCYSGPYTGHIFLAITYPDGTAYGRHLQALSEDAQVQKLLAEASKTVELQERFMIFTQDL